MHCCYNKFRFMMISSPFYLASACVPQSGQTRRSGFDIHSCARQQVLSSRPQFWQHSWCSDVP
jgi:hypothetical protein